MTIKHNCCIWTLIVHIVHIKTKDYYADMAKDVETKLDTSNYKLDRLIPRENIKKCLD